MHAIRQKCRPKHQVLVMKCYPRITKGAVDVKPNSSELSYLLYYATTRRSKVQKVGAFLETKTASDVWRQRIGNVQVTMGILQALIEKAPRDLPLYARYVLQILGLILKSGDITMVEASIPTFEAFCEHHDGASLSADQEYLRLYEDVVRTYAGFASTIPQSPPLATSAPVAMRWRVAGLQAIKSVASSEALASVAGRQLNTIMPVLLQNVWTDDMEYLEVILNRARIEDKEEAERAGLRRRGSIITVKTNDTHDNPLSLSGTAADADRHAEEDIGVLALQGLEKIFATNNRSQIRLGTLATIKFISEKVAERHRLLEHHQGSGEDRGWATTTFIMLARWTPVQERYTILVTAMEALVRGALTDDSVPQELVLATMIGSLLRSDVNLIGLSVMDVLLGLINHVLRLLQLSGAEPHFQPVQSPTSETNGEKGASPFTSSSHQTPGEPSRAPSRARVDLLHTLEQCIGDLATHVYYTDQIADMIQTLLIRLKPTPISQPAAAAAAIEDPQSTTETIANKWQISEHPGLDGFFSLDTAKVSALKAIKHILVVANKRSRLSGANLGRNRVGLRTFENTQWLLRDADGRVRKAYADALVTWLEREMTTEDLLAVEELPATVSTHRGLMKTANDESTDSLKGRAVSAATHREKTARLGRNTFVPLLHLAIYDNSLQYTDSEPDVVLLHLLLVKLLEKLGVNAAKSGLPMIFRLQEDIQEAETGAKIRLGSICHGYFWAVVEKFNLEGSAIGREIHDEIHRRRNKGFWVSHIRYPPMPIDHIGMPGVTSHHEGLPEHELENESLRPFDDRETMMELIAEAYSEEAHGHQLSAPTSPERSFSHPILSHALDPKEHAVMPEKFKNQMLADWSREYVLTSITTASRSASMSGSRTGTQRTHRNYLVVTQDAAGDSIVNGHTSPRHAHQHHSRPPSTTYGLVSNGNGLNGLSRLRPNTGHNDGTPTDSSQISITRVDHLKRVLSGQAPPSRGIGLPTSDSSSESMMSYDGAPSEFSYDTRSITAHELRRKASIGHGRSKSRDRVLSIDGKNPLGSHPVIAGTEKGLSDLDEAPENAHDVPPVPPLPADIVNAATVTTSEGTAGQRRASLASRKGDEEITLGEYLKRTRSKSRGRKSMAGQSVKKKAPQPNGRESGAAPAEGYDSAINLDNLLKGIELDDLTRKKSHVVEPPY